MLDFKDSSVFDSERTRYRRFLNNKLSTLEEEDARMEMEEDSDGDFLLDTETFISSEDSFDFNDLEDMDFDSDFGDSSNRSDISNDQSYKLDATWKTILASPYFLFLYVGKLLIFNTPKKEEWKQVFEMLNKITMFSAVGSILFWLLDFKFIFSLPFQAFTSTLMFISSKLILKYLFKDGETSEEGNPFGEEFGDFEGFEEGDVGGFGDGLGMDNDDLGSFGNMESFDDIFGSDSTDGISEFEGYTPDTSKEGILAPSPVDVSSDAKFDRTLLDVFKKNNVNKGLEVHDRRELVESLSDYIITNDRNFGKWDTIRQGSVEYNNLAYGLFKGLGQISTSFLTDEERMVVIDMKSNPLLYKIEVELPSYFKQDNVQRRVHEIMDAIKESDEDTEVEVYMSFFRGRFVFKFVRPNRNMISLGDILRFYDEEKKSTPLDQFDDPDIGLPILFGLRQMEYPYFVDLEENTSGVIVGGSGSGKSWLTFLMMINFVITNDYNNVNFVILDEKNANFWNQFAKFPHVLGYHYENTTYLDVLRELYAEIDRRKALLNTIGEENFKGLRKNLRINGEHEELKKYPLLIVVVDEITSTMQKLKTLYEDEKERFDEVRAIMSQITQEGRSLGVRLVAIGQRAIDTSIPKNVMANSSFKFGMKMNVENDFEVMFGKEGARASKPSSMGMGLSQVEGVPGLHPIKSLTVGGSNDRQVGKFIRVLALEWVRRSLGQDDLYNQPEGMEFNIAYNRDKFLRESMEDIEQGKILLPNQIDEGYSSIDIGDVSIRKSINKPETETTEDELLSVLEESYTDEKDTGDSDLDDILDNYDDEDDLDEEFDIDSLIAEVFAETTSEPSEQVEETSNNDDAYDDFLSDIVGDNNEGEVDYISPYETIETHTDSEQDNTSEQNIDFSQDIENDIEGLPSMDDNLFDEGINLFGNEEDISIPLIEEEEEDSINTTVPKSTESDLFSSNELPVQDEGISLDDILDDTEEVSTSKFDNSLFDNDTVTSTPVQQEDNIVLPKPSLERNIDNRPKPVSDIERELGIDNTDWEQQPRPKKKVVKRKVKRKVVPKRRQQPAGVQLGFNSKSNVTGNFAPKVSVREYIIQKGQPTGLTTYRIQKENLIVLYGEERILNELEMMTIIEDGDYFITQT